MTITASPRLMRRHSSKRSPSDRPLWRTAMPQLKRRLKRFTSCGVRAISGTSTRAVLPLAEDVGDRLQVDLGLAAAGHAMEKERGESTRIGRGGYPGERLSLGAVQAKGPVALEHLFPERIAVYLPCFRGDISLSPPALSAESPSALHSRRSTAMTGLPRPFAEKLDDKRPFPLEGGGPFRGSGQPVENRGFDLPPAGQHLFRYLRSVRRRLRSSCGFRC